MKKAILLSLATAASFAVSAQKGPRDNDGFRDLKPSKGDVTAELGLTGGIINSDFKLNEGNSGLLRGRYFVTNDLALRLGVNVTANSSKENVYSATGLKGYVYNNNTLVLLNLGIEKHFKGTNRLSPYVGGDILIGFNSMLNKLENTNGTIYTANFLREEKGPNNVTFGLRGVFGADYYIAKNLYLGAEAGLGFTCTSAGETTVTTTNNGVTITDNFKSSGTSFNFSPTVVTGVRIGFVF
jgi:outer membrane protein W